MCSHGIGIVISQQGAGSSVSLLSFGRKNVSNQEASAHWFNSKSHDIASLNRSCLKLINLRTKRKPLARYCVLYMCPGNLVKQMDDA